MTIDLEDWYQDVELKYWHHYEDRIVQNTNKLLTILDETNAHATFFVLGYNAERFPELIENINDKNHEIATHGYDHTPLLKQSPTKFEKELTKSIKILERITKEKIMGYRAPIFSVGEKTSWAIDILKKHLKYDSSIFPTKTPLYGIPKAPQFPYCISSRDVKKTGDNGDFLNFHSQHTEYQFLKRIFLLQEVFICDYFLIDSLNTVSKGSTKKNSLRFVIFIRGK